MAPLQINETTPIKYGPKAKKEDTMKSYVWMLLLVCVVFFPMSVQASLRYTIKPGDTMIKISEKFGVPVPVLKEKNHIQESRLIYAGKKMIIPDTTYVVKKGDTLGKIAHKYASLGATVTNIQKANPSLVDGHPDYIEIGWALTIPRPALDERIVPNVAKAIPIRITLPYRESVNQIIPAISSSANIFLVVARNWFAQTQENAYTRFLVVLICGEIVYLLVYAVFHGLFFAGLLGSAEKDTDPYEVQHVCYIETSNGHVFCIVNALAEQYMEFGSIEKAAEFFADVVYSDPEKDISFALPENGKGTFLEFVKEKQIRSLDRFLRKKFIGLVIEEYAKNRSAIAEAGVLLAQKA